MKCFTIIYALGRKELESENNGFHFFTWLANSGWLLIASWSPTLRESLRVSWRHVEYCCWRQSLSGLWEQHELSAQPCWTLLRSHGPQSATLSCPGDFPGEKGGAGCHFLLQGIFWTQGSSLHLLCVLHWQTGSLPLCHLGNPSKSSGTYDALGPCPWINRPQTHHAFTLLGEKNTSYYLGYFESVSLTHCWKHPIWYCLLFPEPKASAETSLTHELWFPPTKELICFIETPHEIQGCKSSHILILLLTSRATSA